MEFYLKRILDFPDVLNFIGMFWKYVNLLFEKTV